ncbi:MAG: ribosome-recycling factor [Vicinamibacterales bacterium]
MRIPIPSLTEERRKELSRHVHKLAEEGRNQVRSSAPRCQRSAEETAQGLAISEDDEKKGLDEVQKLTDGIIKQIEEMQKKKDADLLGH